VSTASKPQGKAMYMATELDKSWLLNVQTKLYTQSWNEPTYVFHELWGLVTDPRNLRIALARVAHNRGRRTAGVDGITVWKALSLEGADAFLAGIRATLRNGVYAPSPARRVLIPKKEQPGKFQPSFWAAIALLIGGLFLANIAYYEAYSLENIVKPLATIFLGWLAYFFIFRQAVLKLPRLLEQFDHLIGVMSLMLILLFWMVLA